MRNHHPLHAAPARAERHAHADLVRTLRDGVRDHAVDAHSRQHQRRSGEEREHEKREAALRERAREALFHPAQTRHRQERVRGPDGLLDRCRERPRVGRGRAHHQR